jgi:type IV secretion system protein VirB8
MNPLIKKNELKDYYKEAISWDFERLRRMKRSEIIAWTIAGFACVLAIIACLAVLQLTPLKNVEPFIVRVDNTNGVVDNLVRVSDAKNTYNEVLDKYFLAKYLKAREEYDKNTLAENYNTVSFFSNQILRGDWEAMSNPSNPNSNYSKYGDRIKVVITIKTIGFIQRGLSSVANISYVREERASDQPSGGRISHWRAIIDFHYTNVPQEDSARQLDPCLLYTSPSPRDA